MIEYLDPEIANEGVSAESSWAPAVEEARIPSYKGIKSIAKYFPQFTGRPYQHQAYPCYLYHPTEPPRLIRDILSGEDPPRVVKRASEQAKELGCIFRQSTMEERAQGFPSYRWEYAGEWRAVPYHTKFDPHKPDTGKHIVTPKDLSANPNADLIAATVAAVLAKINTSSAPSSSADPEWVKFQAFKAWEKTLEDREVSVGAASSNALHALPEDDERRMWEEEAKNKGLKVDGRWSLARLKAEVEKAE